jgi:hypothetical protein
MAETTVATPALLNGVPSVDITENLHAAMNNGRRMSAILQEVVTLRRAAGKLAPSEFRGCGPLARTEAEEQAWCPRFSGFRDSQARQAITLELAAQPTPFAVQAEKIQPHLCP